MSEITVPHLTIYFDADLHAQDGCGWCIDPSTFNRDIYRYPTYEHLAQALNTWTMYEFIRPATIS